MNPPRMGKREANLHRLGNGKRAGSSNPHINANVNANTAAASMPPTKSVNETADGKTLAGLRGHDIQMAQTISSVARAHLKGRYVPIG